MEAHVYHPMWTMLATTCPRSADRYLPGPPQHSVYSGCVTSPRRSAPTRSVCPHIAKSKSTGKLSMVSSLMSSWGVGSTGSYLYDVAR